MSTRIVRNFDIHMSNIAGFLTDYFGASYPKLAQKKIPAPGRPSIGDLPSRGSCTKTSGTSPAQPVKSPTSVSLDDALEAFTVANKTQACQTCQTRSKQQQGHWLRNRNRSSKFRHGVGVLHDFRDSANEREVHDLRQRVGIALADPRTCREVITRRYTTYIGGAEGVAWGEDARWGKKREAEVSIGRIVV